MRLMKYISLLAFLIVVLAGCSLVTDEQTEVSGGEESVDGVVSEEIVDQAENGEGETMEVKEVVESEEMSFTLVEVAEHGEAEDCWLAIDETVYDVTEFVDEHPGGQAILEGCGTDATELFETRPMGSGTPHSISARELMVEYKIGVLAS